MTKADSIVCIQMRKNIVKKTIPVKHSHRKKPILTLKSAFNAHLFTDRNSKEVNMVGGRQNQRHRDSLAREKMKRPAISSK